MRYGIGYYVDGSIIIFAMIVAFGIIKALIKRASVLQKYSESVPSRNAQLPQSAYQEVFELADSLDIKPEFLQQAITEALGSELEEPVVLHQDSGSDLVIQAHSNGSPNHATLNEIRAQLEYFFNSQGQFQQRNKKLTWKAKPSGISRFFTLHHSPQLTIEQKHHGSKITLSRTVSTLNKLYFFPIVWSFAALMMITAVIYNQVGGDGNFPMVIFASLFLTGSFLAHRFIKRKKNKYRKNMVELMETVQSTIERQFISKLPNKMKTPDIELSELEDEIEVEHSSSTINSHLRH